MPKIFFAKQVVTQRGAGFISVSNSLWSSSGQPGTAVKLADVFGDDTTLIHLQDLTPFQDGIAFGEPFANGTFGALWRSNGTPQGTSIVQPNLQSDVSGMWEWNGSLFFGSSNAQGMRLWRSDGTSAGTVAVSNVLLTSGGSIADAEAFAGSLYFVAHFERSDGFTNNTLYRTDGAAVTRVASMGSGDRELELSGGNLFYRYVDSTFGDDALYRVSTAGQSVLVKDLTLSRTTGTSRDLIDVDGVLFFAASDGTRGDEIWRSDGTTAGTVMVRDIRTGSTGSSPRDFVAHEGQLYFTADDGVSGRELWRTDGTSAGTARVKDLSPGAASTVFGGSVSYQGYLYFTANSALWRTDGSDAGTTLVRSDLNMSGGAVFGHSIYFLASRQGSTNLYVSDGTAAGAVELATGVDGSVGFQFDGRNVAGSKRADILEGGSGNDFVIGGLGADRLTGNAGNDVLIADGALSLTGFAQQIKRLYIATLDRGPDDAGWQGWVTAREGGQSLDSIASGFVGSAEFQQKYGGLTGSAAFVTQIYRNVLDREPDAGGLAANVAGLDSGQLSRTQLVVNFSESQEFKDALLPERHAGQVYRLYGATLARTPDAGGFEGWTEILGGGRGLVDIAGGFVDSPEFQTRYRGLEDAGFVSLLYQNVLGRGASQGEIDGWLARLAPGGGYTRTQVVTGFSESQEYINGTKAALDGFIRSVMAAWSDTLVGGAGDDKLTGGRGADRFVFAKSEGGNDTVYGFDAFDTLELNGFGFTTPAQALAAMSQQGKDVVFSYAGGSITFEDTQLATLQGMGAQGWVFG